jgi:DNA transformation protein
LSYWRLPDRLYDDPEELAAWARRALAIARRRQKKPASRKRAAKKKRR